MLPQGGLQRHSAGPVQKHSAARAQAGSHVMVYFVFLVFFSSQDDLHVGTPSEQGLQSVQASFSLQQSAA
jgi:hypothetical protein